MRAGAVETSNRTTMELKQKSVVSMGATTSPASNRTTMELKRCPQRDSDLGGSASNRTTMELKQHTVAAAEGHGWTF